MVEGEARLSMNPEQTRVTLADLVEIVHVSANGSLLKVLGEDLDRLLAMADEACTRDEWIMSEAVIAYIRALSERLGPRVLN
jgi:hypothetical protein